MRFAATTIATISVQLLLGYVFFALVSWLLTSRGAGPGGLRRRWIVAWRGSSAALFRQVPFAVVALLVGLALAASSSDGVRAALDGAWFLPLPFILFGTLPTAACWLLFHSGGLEARGRLVLARAQARLAGQLTFVGILLLLIFVWFQLLFRVPIRRALVESADGAGVVMLVGMLSLGGSAFIAVIAGLAGKPRPSALFASAFYTIGTPALIAAHQIAAP